MKNPARLFAILLLLAGFVLTCAAQDVAALIGEGDNYAEKTFENQKALDAFMKAVKIAPANDEVLWRISRCWVDIGEHLPSGTKEEKAKQLEYYQKALDFANEAIKANPNGAMGYTRRAIANGRVALFKGIWDSIDLVKQVKADCEKAIALDPNNAAACYVFGRTHAKVCEKSKMIRWPLGLGWGNMDESRKFFEKAIALRPDFIMYRLDAAKMYIEEDEYAKAKEQLVAIASIAVADEDDGKFRKEAQELLSTIKDK